MSKGLKRLNEQSYNPGLSGNVMNPLVNIPFKRQDDEVALSGNQSFTRVSTATYIDPLDGLVKTAAIDTPRFERMSDGGTGILIEGTSTNELLNSNTFSLYGSDVTITQNATLSPDGTITASTVRENTNINVIHGTVHSVSSTPSTNFTYSVYIKPAGRHEGYIQIWGTGITSGVLMRYNLIDKTVINTSPFNTTSLSGSVTAAANGFYRVSMTLVFAVTVQPTAIYIVPTLGFVNLYTGDGVSGFDVWGAQLEALPFASSYIPTAGATVTRASDNLSIAFAGNAPWPDLAHGQDVTVLVDSDIKPHAGMNQHLLSSSLQYSYLWRIDQIGSIFMYIGYNSAGPQNNISVHSGVNRLGYRISSGVRQNHINGSAVGGISKVVVNDSGSATILYIGAWTRANHLYGHLRNFRIYDRALTDMEVSAA